MFTAGDQIGPYTLLNKLGRGAFGVVWLAERRTQITTTRAALKIPLDEEISIDAIRNEADVWVRASGHPNVLPIIEADIYGDHVIIASEYAPDGSLEGYLKTNGKARSNEEAVEIVSGILAGLEHLHSRDIIHRDLKPANILFQGSNPRLADFGISRVLRTTSQSSNIMGTPSYMAPEAFDGKRNERTDLWSVGIILYQLLAGRLPFAEEDITSRLGAILTRDPRPLPPTVPASLRAVLARSLHKDSAGRFESAAEMRSALRSSIGDSTGFTGDRSLLTRAAPLLASTNAPLDQRSTKKAGLSGYVYAFVGGFAVIIVMVVAAASGLYLWYTGPSTGVATPESTKPAQPTASPRSNPDAPPVKKGEYELSMEKYNQIKVGMARSEVESILGGKGTEISSTTGGGVRFSVNKWEGDNFRSIILSFRNDKITTRSQVGLDK